jgi:hypothetical protein
VGLKSLNAYGVVGRTENCLVVTMVGSSRVIIEV